MTVADHDRVRRLDYHQIVYAEKRDVDFRIRKHDIIRCGLDGDWTIGGIVTWQLFQIF
jgi:hypothetical protein